MPFTVTAITDAASDTQLHHVTVVIDTSATLRNVTTVNHVTAVTTPLDLASDVLEGLQAIWDADNVGNNTHFTPALTLRTIKHVMNDNDAEMIKAVVAFARLTGWHLDSSDPYRFTLTPTPDSDVQLHNATTVAGHNAATIFRVPITGVTVVTV